MKTDDETEIRINIDDLKINDSSIYCNSISVPKYYEIDFSKVKIFDDIIVILKVLDIQFSEDRIKGIEHLVRER